LIVTRGRDKCVEEKTNSKGRACGHGRQQLYVTNTSMAHVVTENEQITMADKPWRTYLRAHKVVQISKLMKDDLLFVSAERDLGSWDGEKGSKRHCRHQQGWCLHVTIT
jgi:hypothetical protein